MMLLKKYAQALFERLPFFIQDAYRYPGLYDRIAELKLLEAKSYAERRAYQLTRVKTLLEYAYNHTVYYKNLFNKIDIFPQDIKTLDDMVNIPILTKDIVRQNLNDMVSDAIPSKGKIYVTTGGSTGNPLGFFISKMVDSERLAFEWLHWNRMGYYRGDPCIFLRGRVLPEGKWFDYERHNNFLVLSTFMMTDKLLPSYINKIESFGPKFIQAYPSAISILAKYMLSNNIKLNVPIKAISTSSEILYKDQKALIERAFNAPVYDKYGNCEQVGVIGMHHDGLYREFMEHSYLEYLDTCNQPVKNDGEARIIGTSFINNVVPFIRYDTEDMVNITVSNAKNKSYGPIINSILGRCSGDVMIAKNGNLISVTAMNTHSNIFDNTKRIQYYQDTAGVVVLKIVKLDSYTALDEERILSELRSKFQNQVDLKLEYVLDIPRTARGKYLYLDQRLKGIK